MLAKRTLTALAMALVGFPAIIIGGVFYFLVMGTFITGAAWEYVRMFRAVGLRPSLALTVGGTACLLAARIFLPQAAAPLLAGLVLLAMSIHLLAYEKGRAQAAQDLTVTLGGLIYLGWLGAYLLDLRSLPDGTWWLLLALFPVFMADTMAYFIGVRFGRHRLCPRLSPKKSWEGYWAGALSGPLSGAGLAWLYAQVGGPQVNLWAGALFGLVIASVTPLGDLGESLFKRQADMKDSSNIFPGHGGFFDRIDAWLWAAVIGYYLVSWFFLKA
jgi:phosphatidate cytidylyltransferase